MKTALLLLLALPLTAHAQADRQEYLHRVVQNIGQIRSAAYFARGEIYDPGDTIPTILDRYYKEYDNPADTTIGAAFVRLDGKDTSRFESGYDGQVSVSADHDAKEIVIDDFTTRSMPFRPLSPPFFNYAKNIIGYALTTPDRIEVQLTDEGDSYRFRLTIDEDCQIEFFGKAYRIPAETWDPTSVYEIWIRKADDLPYKIRRAMVHNTSVETVSEVKFGSGTTSELQLAAYFPADYRVLNYGQPAPAKPRFELTGKKAPDWTLNNADGNAVSLGDFSSKVLLINFTGIGCGACHAAIPFLTTLREQFPAEDFDLVAIETWGKTDHSIRVYTQRNGLNYPLLVGAEEVVKSYLPNSAVPVFILLDERRIVRNIFSGYGESTGAEITGVIEKLLKTQEKTQ